MTTRSAATIGYDEERSVSANSPIDISSPSSASSFDDDDNDDDAMSQLTEINIEGGQRVQGITNASPLERMVENVGRIWTQVSFLSLGY